MNLGLFTGWPAGGSSAPADPSATADAAATPVHGDAAARSCEAAFRALLNELSGSPKGRHERGHDVHEAERGNRAGGKDQDDQDDPADGIDAATVALAFQPAPVVPQPMALAVLATNAAGQSSLPENSSDNLPPAGAPPACAAEVPSDPSASQAAGAILADASAGILADAAIQTLAQSQNQPEDAIDLGRFDRDASVAAADGIFAGATSPVLAAIEAAGSFSGHAGASDQHSSPAGTPASTPMAALKSLRSTTEVAPIPAHLLALAPASATPTLRLVQLEAPVQTPVPTEVAPQIVQAIRLAWTRNSGEARIHLDPRQFGAVSVSLRVEDGGVVARVQAEQPAVREWLQTNQRALQGALTDRQLTLERLEVVSPSDEGRESTDRDHRDRDQRAPEARPRRPRRGNGSSFEVMA